MPGPGFVTVRGNVPVFATSDALRVIVSWPASDGVMAVCGDPLTVTVLFGRKLLPRIERTIEFVPAAAEDGLRLVTLGWGDDGVDPVTVKIVWAPPPPGCGLITAVIKLPVCERSEELRVMAN